MGSADRSGVGVGGSGVGVGGSGVGVGVGGSGVGAGDSSGAGGWLGSAPDTPTCDEVVADGSNSVPADIGTEARTTDPATAMVKMVLAGARIDLSGFPQIS
ncbi:hypothetical protein AYL44_00775 [Microbacterium oleivorans]|uniref:Uncharacterized protein n=1 Tax=Microbacterium oleivorans TaxID=273677 RepID=A0A177KCJ7_9MICO|nr:hypothetical protein AYL44_00775 [Microbacterium oleivorans]